MIRAIQTGVSALAILVAGAVAAGCGSLPSVGPKPQGGEETSGGGGGDTYAGTWTMEREGADALVFDVQDDGSQVTGNRTAGEGFSAYTLALSHQSDGSLKGKAKFELSDVPGKSFETAWEVKKSGEGLTVKREYLELNAQDEVENRGTETVKVAFAPAAAPAGGGEQQPPPAAPAIDMSAYVAVLPSYKHLLAEDIAVGQWIQTKTATEMAGVPPQNMETKTAVVAETDDAWVLEMDNQMNQKDLMLAVFVQKSDGRTTKAYVGNRGKQAKEKEVPPMPEEQPVQQIEGTDVEVTVEAGTFPAKLYEVQGSKSWTGVEGEAEGVLLKSEHSAGQDELKQLEGDASFSAGGTDFPCKHLVYTSGNEMWMAKDQKPPLNQALLRMLIKNAQMTSDTQLVGTGTDAKPEMEYPR